MDRLEILVDDDELRFRASASVENNNLEYPNYSPGCTNSNYSVAVQHGQKLEEALHGRCWGRSIPSIFHNAAEYDE